MNAATTRIVTSIGNSPYGQATNELYRRISELAKKEPKVLECDDPFQLFKLGLKVDDLQPSLAQAMACLAAVKREAGACRR